MIIFRSRGKKLYNQDTASLSMTLYTFPIQTGSRSCQVSNEIIGSRATGYPGLGLDCTGGWIFFLHCLHKVQKNREFRQFPLFVLEIEVPQKKSVSRRKKGVDIFLCI